MPESCERATRWSAMPASASPHSGMNASSHGDSSNRWSSIPSTTIRSNSATPNPVTDAGDRSEEDDLARPTCELAESFGRRTGLHAAEPRVVGGFPGGLTERVERVHHRGALRRGHAGDDLRDLGAPPFGDGVHEPPPRGRQRDRHLAPVGRRLPSLQQLLVDQPVAHAGDGRRVDRERLRQLGRSLGAPARQHHERPVLRERDLVIGTGQRADRHRDEDARRPQHRVDDVECAACLSLHTTSIADSTSVGDMAEVLSVNVGRPRSVEWHGRTVETGIWKAPVDGRIAVRGENLAGDEQADLRVHGGPDKAVYAYALEDYEWWSKELGTAPRTGHVRRESHGTRHRPRRRGDRHALGSRQCRVAGHPAAFAVLQTRAADGRRRIRRPLRRRGAVRRVFPHRAGG